MRVVVDANVFVSAFIAPKGTSGALIRNLVEDDRTVFLVTRETMEELMRVLTYPKIMNLLKLSPNDVNSHVSSMEMLSEEVDETLPVSGLDCRDADDVKYMSVAVSGRAEYLVTGDKDLLVIESVEGIPIVTPAQLLARITGDSSGGKTE